MPALAGLKRFAASRNGKLALGGTAVGGVVAAGLLTRSRSGGDPSALIPYSEVQGTSGVNAGSFPSLDASGVSVGEYEALVNQLGALADKVDANAAAATATAPGVPPPQGVPITSPGGTTGSKAPATWKPTAAQPYPPGLAATTRYTVKAGDTLSAIAAKFRLPGGYKDLLVWNTSITNPDLIRPGQVLIVPKV